jgi:rRNA processing protein Krr1/Pno1
MTDQIIDEVDYYKRSQEALHRVEVYRAMGDHENARQAIEEFKHCTLSHVGTALYGHAWWDMFRG